MRGNQNIYFVSCVDVKLFTWLLNTKPMSGWPLDQVYASNLRWPNKEKVCSLLKYTNTKIHTQFLYLSIYTQVQKFTNTPDRVSGINVYSWQSKKRICWLLKCINTITHIYAYTNTQLHTRKYKYTNTLQVSNSKLRDSLISVIGAASPNTLSRPNPRRRESKPLVAPPSFVSLGGFQTPPTKMSYTTPHYYPKYEI